MRLVKNFTTFLALLCFVATTLCAQTTSGSMSGTVTDPNGAVIPGAKVLVTHEPTKRDFETVTTNAGLYVFSTLPAGPYTLTVTQPGFKKNVQTGIEIRVALRNTVDVKLALGDVAESVEVKAEVPLLEVTTPMRGQNLSPQLVATLPIFSGGLRSAESFVGYMPGVNTNAETSINGSIGRSREVLIDGASIVIPESGGVVWYFPGFEAFQEFKLITSSFNAEHGRLGGGIEVMVSKSGTNDLHGAAFYNLRRDIFQAAGWSQNHVVGRKPGYRAKERYNEEGAVAGGPVYIPKVYDGRNRTFFYFTYAKDVRPASLGYNTGETVPTTRMKQGDFGQVSTIYDPATTSGQTRQPFANNIIPKERWSTISTNILPYIPNPTGSGVTSNYDYITTTNIDDYIFTVKLDHSITPTNRISYFHTQRKQMNITDQYMPGPLSNGLDVLNAPINVRVNHDYVPTPTMLIHTTFGFTRDLNKWNNPLQYGFASKVGFDLTGDPDATPYITFATDSLTGWGMNQGKVNNGWQSNWTTHVNQQLTWTRGKHEVKMGWDIRRMRTIDAYPTFQNGNYTFSRIQTAYPTSLSSTGNSFASFLLGAPNYGKQLDPNFTTGQFRYSYHAGFIQDTWRINSRLTLDYGVRYEVPIGWHDVNGAYSSFDPSKPNSGADGLPGALIFAGIGAGRTGDKRLYPTDFSSIGPRAGFAYRATEKTVIRGGFGMFYQSLGNGGCGSGAGTGGCTDGVNGNVTMESDGLNPAFYWDSTRNVPKPAGYQPPPRIEPTYANFGTVYHMGPNFGKAPRIYNWSLTIQQEIKNWLFEAAYVGNRGHGLNSTVYLNQLPTSYLSMNKTLITKITDSSAAPFSKFVSGWGSSATVAQSLRPFPQYGNVFSANAGMGRTWYDSLQTKVERRFGNLNLMGSWVWSKSLANMTYRQIFAQGNQVQAQDHYNLNDAKSFSYMDIPHFVNIIASYQLPFGKGKKFFSGAGRAMDLLVGGWTVSSTQQYRSGGLIQIISSTNQLEKTIFSPVQKATPTGYGIRTGVAASSLDPDDPTSFWFNHGTEVPYKNTAAYTLGSAAMYNSEFRNPWYRQENFSIAKSFEIWESVRLNYRADAFNLFNRTSFGGVTGTLGAAKFGRPTAPQNAARVITMGLRLEF
ncbi:MAG: TonB-dependent receptor [Bryobacteraceae bacterium]